MYKMLCSVHWSKRQCKRKRTLFPTAKLIIVSYFHVTKVAPKFTYFYKKNTVFHTRFVHSRLFDLSCEICDRLN